MCGRLVVHKTINLQPGSRECATPVAAFATTRATIALSCGPIRHSKAIDFTQDRILLVVRRARERGACLAVSTGGHHEAGPVYLPFLV